MACCNCSNETLAFHGCCCDANRCLAPEPSQGPPGPQGEQGEPGADGTNGVNAFTFSTVAFVMPAIGSSVEIPVLNGTWPALGQPLYVQTAGVFTVVSIDNLVLELENTGASGNASPGTNIAISRQIAPSGYSNALLTPLDIADGGTGKDNATDAFDALSPLTNPGDLITYSAGSNIRIGAGTLGYILTSDGAAPPVWAANTPDAANITGILGVVHGGTGASSESAARTSLAVPGKSDNNTYTGTQAFNGSSFAATISTFAAFLFTAAARSIYDLAGTISGDFANRRLEGSWTQTFKSKTVASASTFSAWTNVETVVSTYSATGTQAITLPAGSDGRVVRIIDGGGLAGTNAITISRSGSDTILGATSYALNLNYGAVAFIFQASNTNWNRLP